MATTTATITLSSADLLSDNLSLSSTTTLYDAGTTTGLTQYAMGKVTVVISINAAVLGRLYSGDWMFIPWSQTDADADIEIYCPASLSTTCNVEYAIFHQGKTFTAA